MVAINFADMLFSPHVNSQRNNSVVRIAEQNDLTWGQAESTSLSLDQKANKAKGTTVGGNQPIEHPYVPYRHPFCCLMILH